MNKENRNRFQRDMPFIPVSDFVFEFGTIRLDVGRAVGKSEFIKTHATKRDIILTYWSTRDYKRFADTGALVAPGIGLSLCNKLLGSRRSFDTIYVDEPHLMFKSDNKMYEALRPLINNTSQTIVILGR